MKKIAAILSALALCMSLCAQGHYDTKKFKISDFREKTMKVVLTGNDMFDAVYKEEMQKVWHISPYEFCTMDEFEARKTSEDFYFLTITEDKFKKDKAAGITSLTLYKGSPNAQPATQGTVTNVEGLYEVITLPFSKVGETTNTTLAFIPALLSIFQEKLLVVMDREFNVGSSVSAGTAKALKKWPERALIDEKDFTQPMGISLKAIYKEENIDVAGTEDVINAISQRTPGVLAGYVVAPDAGKGGNTSYVMLINAQTWELYYIKKHIISSKKPAGFAKDDIKSIIAHKKKK